MLHQKSNTKETGTEFSRRGGRQKRTARIKILFACCVLAALCVLGGCSQSTSEDTPASVQSGQETATAVQVQTVQLGDISTTYTYSGTVRPNQEVSVFSTLQGTVDAVYFDVGDEVTAGDVLFQMDTEALEDNLAVLQAQLAAADAGVSSAETAVELVDGASMQSQILSAQAAAQQAALTLENTRTTYENNKQLYEAGILSKTEMDQTEMGLRQAEIANDQAQQALALITEQLPEESRRQANDGLRAAQAQKEAVEAQIASAQKSLDDAAVTSPISGVVSSCTVTENTLMSTALGAPFTIIDTSTVKLSVGVSEQLINRLHVGDPVQVTVSAASEEPFEGVIHTVSPAAGQTGTYAIEVELDNPDGLLKSGMFAEVVFTGDRSENTVILPRSAVLSDTQGDYVFVENSGTVRRADVETGIDNGDEIEITSGLSEGDRVVVKGQEYLSDGTSVTVQEPEEE